MYPRTRAAWRDWLVAHHRTVTSTIWLVYDKGEPIVDALSYVGAVEEALCFGWIDSRVNKLDDARYMQLFSPRKATSTWARTNKERVERLIAAGLMAPAGLQMIEVAKANGMWTALDEIDNLSEPGDLTEAFDGDPAARTVFDAFAPSVRKGVLWWIKSAKRPETRAKRVAETVRLSAEGRKPGPFAG